MEFEDELYAERLRRRAQQEGLSSGTLQWTTEFEPVVRTKLKLAWTETTEPMGAAANSLSVWIQRRTLRSLGDALNPGHMGTTAFPANYALSLLESQHEALVALVDEYHATERSVTSTTRAIAHGPRFFQSEVNRIMDAHIVGYHLHHNSRIVPIQSGEMHDSVVEPTLYLLHSQPQFAAAETAYQEALTELRNRKQANAITDAGTALQDALKAIGCTGSNLTQLLASAKTMGFVRENESPLLDAIPNTIRWATRQRNEGESHQGDPGQTMSDAWMMVHVVGALIIRLSESAGIPNS